MSEPLNDDFVEPDGDRLIEADAANEELVAAARAVVEMWRESHLYEHGDFHTAVDRLAGLLSVERDGRDWTPKDGDAF